MFAPNVSLGIDQNLKEQKGVMTGYFYENIPVLPGALATKKLSSAFLFHYTLKQILFQQSLHPSKEDILRILTALGFFIKLNCP